MGYVLRDEIWKYHIDDSLTEMLKQAYNLNDEWIGESKFAYRLANRYGITYTEKKEKQHSVCSIGFSEKKQKWYGWSHRAIYGFGIGSKVVKGNCAFKPSNMEERIQSYMQFWECNKKFAVEKIKKEDEEYNDFEYGKGKWEAKTLANAKQMAIDFSDGVS